MRKRRFSRDVERTFADQQVRAVDKVIKMSTVAVLSIEYNCCGIAFIIWEKSKRKLIDVSCMGTFLYCSNIITECYSIHCNELSRTGLEIRLKYMHVSLKMAFKLLNPKRKPRKLQR